MLLNTKKMQIKSTTIYHCISISMALTKTPPKNQNKTNKKKNYTQKTTSVISKDVEKLELLCTF